MRVGKQIMHNEYLSLCIVTFNNADKIEKVVNNLTKVLNGNIDYRLYIVDNGSTDNTINLIREEQKRNNCISLIEKNSNLGFGSGHNSIIRSMNSTFHIVINPDVYINSFVELKKMISYMEDNKNVGLLSPLILNEDGTIQRLYKYNPTVLDLLIRFISPNFLKHRQENFVRMNSGYNKIGHIDYASGSFMMFRTSVFKKIGGFDERFFMYLEDADITRRVNGVSNAVFFPDSFVTHEWQRESHKKLKYTGYTISSIMKYFNKWGWKVW